MKAYAGYFAGQRGIPFARWEKRCNLPGVGEMAESRCRAGGLSREIAALKLAWD